MRPLRDKDMRTPKDRKRVKNGREDTPFHFDAKKSRVDVLPPSVLLSVGDVFAYGAGKYGERNWEQYAEDWDWCQLYASAMRHLIAWAGGEDIDPESGLPHLDHAVCNLMMLQGLIHAEKGNDDRTQLRAVPRAVAGGEEIAKKNRASEGRAPRNGEGA